MSLQTLSIILTLCCLALNGCGITKMNDFNDRLSSLSNPPQPEALAALARDADAAAQKDAEPLDRVALYRVAAVASWQAGEAGERLVLPVTDAGIASCEALPSKDQAAPRDCSLIRLAAPLAVQDDLARDLVKLQGQLQQLEDNHRRQCSTLTGAEQERCRAARAKLRLPTYPRYRTCSLASRCNLRRSPPSAAAWPISMSMMPFDARRIGSA